jgi:hypothetical protein
MIQDEMRFIGFKDFYKRSRKIKSMYDKLSLEEKWTYKYYVYSNALVSQNRLDLIWEYLNEPENSEYFVSRKKLGEQYLKARV